MMLEAVYLIKDNIYFAWFALLIFFAGFCCSYAVNYFNIKALLWFPRLFLKVLSRHVNPKVGFVRIFWTIFLFNSISIAVYMCSGVLVALPYIITFFTGMNIGLTVFIPPQMTIEGYDFKMPRSQGRLLRAMIFSSMVLIFEVITFCLALGMGMSLQEAALSARALGAGSLFFVYELIEMRLIAYCLVCVPVLALSAYLEAFIISGD